MPSAKVGLELPATSLMAPLLPAMPALLDSALLPSAREPHDPTSFARFDRGGAIVFEQDQGQKQRPDTSRPPGWQYESGPCPRRIFCLDEIVFALGKREPKVARTGEMANAQTDRPCSPFATRYSVLTIRHPH